MHCLLVDLKFAFEILSQLDVSSGELKCLILDRVDLLHHFDKVAASHREVLLILTIILESLKFCEGDRGQTIYREIFALLQMLSCLLVCDLLSMVANRLLASHFKGGLLQLLSFLLNIDIILRSVLDIRRLRCIADLRIISSSIGIEHVLGNGWIQLELLVHAAHQREQIVVRLPV